jgi:hypothetical protein
VPHTHVPRYTFGRGVLCAAAPLFHGNWDTCTFDQYFPVAAVLRLVAGGHGTTLGHEIVAGAALRSVYAIGKTDLNPILRATVYFQPVEPSEPKPPADAQSPSENEPMLYCPVCSVRLEQRKCKLFCPQCGYYMSCADYY